MRLQGSGTATQHARGGSSVGAGRALATGLYLLVDTVQLQYSCTGTGSVVGR